MADILTYHRQATCWSRRMVPPTSNPAGKASDSFYGLTQYRSQGPEKPAYGSRRNQSRVFALWYTRWIREVSWVAQHVWNPGLLSQRRRYRRPAGRHNAQHAGSAG